MALVLKNSKFRVVISYKLCPCTPKISTQNLDLSNKNKNKNTPTNSENVLWPKPLGSINRYGFEMKTMDALIANQLAIHAVCRSQEVETGNPASSRA